MEDKIPDFQQYLGIAKSKGFSEEFVRHKFISLIDETKSYIGAMKILMKLISKGELDITNEKESKNNLG